MEKLNFTQKVAPTRKVFFKKEIEADRLGEELYSEDVLSQYSVYLLRKFELGEEYDTPEQFTSFVSTLPKSFNEEFEDCVVRKMYMRVTPKAVYLTFSLALAHPLSKLQISDLRTWISHLIVPEMALEHLSNFSNQATSEIRKDIQETNGEILLLSEMMDQFSENLAELYTEVQTVKQVKTPPIFKIVASQATPKETQASVHSEQLNLWSQRVEQLADSFAEFEKETNNRFKKLPKSKKPPKFKIIRGATPEGPTNEEQLQQALVNIDRLTKHIQTTDEQVAILNKTVALLKKEKPKVSFSKAKYANASAGQLAETNEKIQSLVEKMADFDQQIETVALEVSEVKPEIQTIARLEKEQEALKDTTEFEATITQLTKKLDMVTVELDQMKQEKKQIPVVKLTKSTAMQEMMAERLKNQQLLKSNATEIKKLTQLVGKVDVQLIKAHQKIAELEQKIRQQATATNTAQALKNVHQSTVPATPTPPKQQEEEKTVEITKESAIGKRDFPTKETFLQATKPVQVTSAPERETVTLAIEEVLDRVSEQPATQISDSLVTHLKTNPLPQESGSQEAVLMQLKKLEWSIHASFQKTRSLGHKGMMARDEFHARLQKIEDLPTLWEAVYAKEKKDIVLGNNLSSQQLIRALPEFSENVKRIAQKRKVMGKWIYCPKEMEHQLTGYTLLSDYLEVYMKKQAISR